MLHDFTKDKFDIIIQAGQSNSEGYGFGPTDAPYQPDGRVWYLNQDRTITLAAEKVTNNGIQSNFALSFVREYLNAGKLAEGRQLLIVRAAVGGTGFLDNHWKPADVLFLQMMDMVSTALALNPENRLVALLWHQGETDAGCHATYDQHYNHLTTLLRLVRTTYQVPDLPFIAGDFVQDWKSKNVEIVIPVIDAIRAVCADCGRGGFVETADLKSNAQEGIEHPLGWLDDIHFSRRSIYELGKRYFAKFVEITDKTE
jgi:hypothetical protein